MERAEPTSTKLILPQALTYVAGLATKIDDFRQLTAYKRRFSRSEDWNIAV
jgi:hypothetical protein